MYYAQTSTCMELEDVTSICDGRLRTIHPTAALNNEYTKRKRELNLAGKMNYEVLERPNDYSPEPILITPTLAIPQIMQS